MAATMRDWRPPGDGRPLAPQGQGDAGRPDGDVTSHAVGVYPPTAENPHGYHRLIGGGVELGETDGSVQPLAWRPLRDADEPLPLYPGAVVDWVRVLAASG